MSKKMAEQAAWKFVEDNKTTFDLTVINQDIVIGPMLHPVASSRNINETNRFAIYNFVDETHKVVESVRFPYYHLYASTVLPVDFDGEPSMLNVTFHQVDVRDVAKAHVLAMTTPGASNKRILLASGLITQQLVANIIRKRLLELRDRVSKGNPDQIYPKGVNPTGWDVSGSHEIFGKECGYRDLVESVTDTVWDIPSQEE